MEKWKKNKQQTNRVFNINTISVKMYILIWIISGCIPHPAPPLRATIHYNLQIPLHLHKEHIQKTVGRLPHSICFAVKECVDINIVLSSGLFLALLINQLCTINNTTDQTNVINNSIIQIPWQRNIIIILFAQFNENQLKKIRRNKQLS